MLGSGSTSDFDSCQRGGQPARPKEAGASIPTKKGNPGFDDSDGEEKWGLLGGKKKTLLHRRRRRLLSQCSLW
jgi:hypothetical protein